MYQNIFWLDTKYIEHSWRKVEIALGCNENDRVAMFQQFLMQNPRTLVVVDRADSVDNASGSPFVESIFRSAHGLAVPANGLHIVLITRIPMTGVTPKLNLPQIQHMKLPSLFNSSCELLERSVDRKYDPLTVKKAVTLLNHVPALIVHFAESIRKGRISLDQFVSGKFHSIHAVSLSPDDNPSAAVAPLLSMYRALSPAPPLDALFSAEYFNASSLVDKDWGTRSSSNQPLLLTASASPTDNSDARSVSSDSSAGTSCSSSAGGGGGHSRKTLPVNTRTTCTLYTLGLQDIYNKFPEYFDLVVLELCAAVHGGQLPVSVIKKYNELWGPQGVYFSLLSVVNSYCIAHAHCSLAVCADMKDRVIKVEEYIQLLARIDIGRLHCEQGFEPTFQLSTVDFHLIREYLHQTELEEETRQKMKRLAPLMMTV